MGTVNEARKAAHASLVSCLVNDKFVNLEVSTILKRTNLQGADRGLYTALVYGTIERLITIDYYISKLSQRPIAELDEKIEASGADYQELTRLLGEKEQAEEVLMELMQAWEDAQE